uniref:Uncharacterized protein n=1 Tax=Tanacetum cinerariifolium TaxID=118510 RepID=A0A699GQF5_TANCI|nr:hypothetical protein [Tanacetum cinerariifolium]
MRELTFFLGLQVKQSEKGIFISQDKSVAEILKKFDFSSVRTAGTPIKTQKPLVKDEEAADVDFNLYRSMIRSLMYLIASRPDIMFVVRACSRFQVTLKLSHLHTVKRIFRLLKEVDFIAVQEADIVATSTTEAEDSYEKKLIHVLKIHIEDNVADLLTKAFDVSSVSSILVSIGPLSHSSSSCLRTAISNYGVSLGIPTLVVMYLSCLLEEQCLEPALNLNVHCCGREVFDLEKVKTAQANEVSSLKKRVTTLEQRQISRILGFHSFRASTSRRHSLEVIVEDKGSGEKGGNTAEIVSTARSDISAARPKVSTAEPKTPPTITTLFDDEDVTIADTLVKMKSQKSKEKGVAFKDADDSTRPIRSITTLQPLPTIDPKDKDKGILQEPEPVNKTKKRDQDQIERDVEVALKIQAVLDKEVRTERERQEMAPKAALAGLYDENSLKEGRNSRFTHAQLKSRSFEEIKKLHTKEQKWVDAFVCIGYEEDEKRVGSRKKRAVGSSSKQKSPKKQKVNDQESVDSDKELKICLKKLGTMEAGDVYVYKLTRLYGSYRHFSTFSRMLEVLDRQDMLDLHKIMMERFPTNDLEGYDLIL